jgi:phospholipase/carboxylesterase
LSADRVQVDTGPNPRHAVVWLHGLGADGHDFEPIVPEISRGLPPIRFIFPHAPVRPVTINGGMAMRAWYDITGSELAAREDAAGIMASVQLTHQLLDEQRTAGIASDRLLLAGFSQGGAITLAAGLRYPHTLAGLVALSTYLPLRDRLAPEAHVENLRTPIFMAHGAMDPVVPQKLGELSRDALSALGYAVAWHSYPRMGHFVVQEEIAQLRAFLSARLL